MRCAYEILLLGHEASWLYGVWIQKVAVGQDMEVACGLAGHHGYAMYECLVVVGHREFLDSESVRLQLWEKSSDGVKFLMSPPYLKSDSVLSVRIDI